MPELESRQSAKIIAGTMLNAAEGYAKRRCVTITSEAAHALAQNDTVASGLKLPIGTRILPGSMISNAALGASVTVDVGLRNFKTKTAIDANGIAAAVAVSSAQVVALNNGALIAAGNDYITTEESEVYLTFGGANPTDNAQFVVTVEIATQD